MFKQEDKKRTKEKDWNRSSWRPLPVILEDKEQICLRGRKVNCIRFADDMLMILQNYKTK